MPLDFVDRRTPDNLTHVIDDALELAEECGWRYALAFLISERVPSQIIQRLLSGGGRTRQAASEGMPIFQGEGYSWKGRNTEAMVSLFDSLRARGLAPSCTTKQSPLPSRSSIHSIEDE